MAQLFDHLGPAQRSAPLAAAVRTLAEADDTGRGAVFTRREVVEAILDLAGYSAHLPLFRSRLLEPSFGNGDFLLPAVERMLTAYARHGGTAERASLELRDAIRGVELNRSSFGSTRTAMYVLLEDRGFTTATAHQLVEGWLIHDDFLLTPLQDRFDFIIGNPPYVRQERIPAELIAEYRRRYQTVYDRADIYIPFFERSLDLLAVDGRLGFICANRWLKNKYGGPLRAKIAARFHLAHFVDMENTDAFHSDVIAYPAITVVTKPVKSSNHGPTRVARQPAITADSLGRLTHAMLNGGHRSDPRVHDIIDATSGSDPWLLDNPDLLALLRRLEASFPPLEEAGCEVGIGVATGADRVFIGDFRDLPVENERKLPLVMAGDLQGGRLIWGGKGVLNPFEHDGSLASLAAFPMFRLYLEQHRAVVAGRHVAKKSPVHWYRTIDRINPRLTSTPKLLIPDIKGSATVVWDEGQFYPHHNLYFVTAKEWDLRALQTVLRSSVALAFVSAYCVRMAGGFLRFQAQYLRRIRLPPWHRVNPDLRRQLAMLGEEHDMSRIDQVVFALYGLTPAEAVLVGRAAAEAQVNTKSRRQG